MKRAFSPIPTLAALLLATPAAALSCLPPSVEQAFAAAHAAPEIYVPVLGRFTGFDQRPETQTINGADRTFTAGFEGRGVTADGPGRELIVEVAMTETCLGSWCPAFPPDTEVLTFLRRDGDGYAFEVNACHGNYFTPVTDQHLDTLRTCLRDMACPEG